MLKLIPKPRKALEKGLLSKNRFTLQELPEDPRLVKAAEKLPLINEGGIPLSIIAGSLGDESESYTLDLFDTCCVIKADSSHGAFLAIQTLRQLMSDPEPKAVHIEDEPVLQHRGFYHDLARGKVPTVETLKKLIDTLAYFKYNSLQLYTEHAFECPEYADVLSETGCLTPDELRELDDYCYENFIDFIPSLSTFGHLYILLMQEKYRHLQELENYQEDQSEWISRQQHHTLDPTKEESFELIKGIIDQYVPLFRSKYFNICCDETFDLTEGKHREEDTGKLYTDFVLKLVKHLQSKGKTVMMWADIILKHLDYIEELPEDIIYLNWWYEAEVPESKISRIADTKRPQILCPGTSSWLRFAEDTTKGPKNIRVMAEYALKYRAGGLLNTNWGDYGNVCSLALAMYGTIYGAEYAWNVKSNPRFDACIDALFYYGEGSTFIKRLSKLQSKASWRAFVHAASMMMYPRKFHLKPLSKPHTQALLNDLRAFSEDLEMAVIRPEVKQEMRLAAEAIRVYTEIRALSEGMEIERTTNTEEFLSRFHAQWILKNKESEYKKVEKLFTCFSE